MLRLTHVGESEVLFSESAPADQLYALRSGMVKLVKSLENGKGRILRIISPGTVFGLETLDGTAHPATAVTLQDSDVCIAPRNEFATFLRSDPEIAQNMIRLLAAEITQLTKEVADLSFKDARGKVAMLLHSLLPRPRPSPDRTWAVELPLSTQEIGEILELTPETVSRAWSGLRRQGVIEKHGRKVIVNKPHELEQAARH